MWFGRFLARQSKTTYLIVASVLLVLIGILDHITGDDLILTLFYLAPIGLVTWSIGIRAGMIFSILSGVAIYISNYLFIPPPQLEVTTTFVAVFNTLIGFFTFVIVTVLLHRIKESLERQRQLASELERRVTELHALQQWQEDLLSIVSHDLRNPLAVIHGYNALLKETIAQRGIDGDLTLSSNAIERNVYLMRMMLQDLLDSSGSPSQRVVLACTAVELPAYLHDFLRRSSGIISGNRITLDVPAALAPVSADSNRLERILWNLLSNALKYSASDSPVCLRARQDKQEMVISVSDQGAGIAPEDLPHLFERYYRTEAGRRKAEGVGLGLYITKLLVEAHGGRIWVDSQPGYGSTFSFTLPLA